MVNILIVEDNDDINNLIKNYITKAGYNCHQAYSGTEALIYFQTNTYDLIILDLMLPGMNGRISFKQHKKCF